MNRRQFAQMLCLSAGTALLPRIARAQAATQPLALRYAAEKIGPTIAADYVGLSYERAQLSNPAYFSAANRDLIALFRGLSSQGNLRIGGSSGEHTNYIGDRRNIPPFEIFGPEHNKSVKEGLVVSTESLRTLRGFLDATGWSCLYGLNLAHATPASAAREAADVARILGDRLMALQIGNEPDVFRNRYRPASWGPADFLREWDEFHAAIVQATPGVKFAGPDTSNKLDYVAAFAAQAHRYPDIIMLTGHYYAMGPAGSPDATLDQLFVPEARTTTLKQSGVAIIQQAVATSGLPFRMAEGNSCWDGGKPGVSDTHASALWGADTMLRFAERGWIGVNWHGGGNGHYSPIVGSPSTGFTRRPLYYGTQFAQMLDGATFLASEPLPHPALGSYALRQKGADRIVLINKSEAPIVVTLPRLPERQWIALTGPALAAKEGTTLRRISQKPDRNVTVPPATALLLTLRGRA